VIFDGLSLEPYIMTLHQPGLIGCLERKSTIQRKLVVMEGSRYTKLKCWNL